MTALDLSGIHTGGPHASQAVRLPVDQTWPDLLAIIEDAILNDPRTLQVELGPSELGTDCDRCLVHLLAGHKAVEHVAPWLPTIGHAVHAWLEQAVFASMLPDLSVRRYITEGKVAVGHIGGRPITGSSDLFDTHTGTVVDWKISGKPKIDTARRKGETLTYRRQAHLYGKGWEDGGFDVRSVSIIRLPRNAVSVRQGNVFQEPYDRAIAEQALARANALHAGITALGVDAVLAMTGPHTGAEFTCDKFPGETTAGQARQLDGLIPPQSPATNPGAGSAALT